MLKNVTEPHVCTESGTCLREALWQRQTDMLNAWRDVTQEAQKPHSVGERAVLHQRAIGLDQQERQVRSALLRCRAPKCTGEGGCGTVYRL